MKIEELVTLRGGYDGPCNCANAWAPGVYPWEPPTYTFTSESCSLVADWMYVWEGFGYYTSWCSYARQ
jgi:hypothetical protein